CQPAAMPRITGLLPRARRCKAILTNTTAGKPIARAARTVRVSTVVVYCTLRRAINEPPSGYESRRRPRACGRDRVIPHPRLVGDHWARARLRAYPTT